jgi:drug/metabolite transporter (DMT)-like permease
MQRFQDWMLLILCNLIWASQFVMVKLVQQQMGPVFATFFPMTLAMLILIPIVRREKKKRAHTTGKMPWQDILAFMIIGIVGQVVAQLFITWGSGLSLASNAALLFLTLPIVTSVMAYLILGERMTWRRVVSFAFAILGVLASSGIDIKELNFSDKRYLWGNVLIFLSINGSAFYNVYSKKLLTRYTPLQVLLYSYYAVVAFMLPIALYLEPQAFGNLPHFTPTVWLGLFILAVFQYAISMVIFMHVLARLDAIQAGLMNYLIPFLGVLIAWLILDEHLSLFMILGGILALASTLLATVFEKDNSGAANIT